MHACVCLHECGIRVYVCICVFICVCFSVYLRMSRSVLFLLLLFCPFLLMIFSALWVVLFFTGPLAVYELLLLLRRDHNKNSKLRIQSLDALLSLCQISNTSFVTVSGL